MITSSISIVDTTMRCPCWAATAPAGCSKTMLQPPNRAAGSTSRMREPFGSDMPTTLGVARAVRDWTFCPIGRFVLSQAGVPGCDPYTAVTTLHDTHHSDHSRIAPGEIAIGVIIGRASEFFDFFVYGIASVLVFPALFFPFATKLQGTL